MQTKTIKGILMTGLTCFLGGGFLYWFSAILLAGLTRGNNPIANHAARASLLLMGLGAVLLFISVIAFRTNRRR